MTFKQAALAGQPASRLLRWAGLLAALGLAAAGGCARDVNKGGGTEPLPLEIVLSYRTADVFDTNTWYYMVFNFSKAPQTDANSAPLDIISNEDRGRNWEMYIAYHKDPDLGDQFYVLQRPRMPSVLPTETGPVDAISGDFNPTDDTVHDLAVACRDADAVQIIPGQELVVKNNVYFEDAFTVNTGPAPIRVFATDIDADTDADLVVVFQGDESGDPFIRVLLNDGLAAFTAQADVPLPEKPIDAVMADFDPPAGGASVPDLAIITEDATGNGTLRMFSGSAGSYVQTHTAAVGAFPNDVAAGNLDAEDLDVVVSNFGQGSGPGSLSVLLGDGTGNFGAQSLLNVDGQPTAVSIATMFGAGSDVVYTYIDSTGTGQLAVYLKENADPFATTPIVTPLADPAVSLATLEAGDDNRVDALVVNGQPGTSKTNLTIIRGDREPVAGQPTQFNFIWSDEPIIYPCGTEPSRIGTGDLNGDSRIDLLIPCSGGGDNGNRVALGYGLGKNNYASIDVYWTDKDPQLLTNQRWFIPAGSFVSGGEWRLTIDPNEFFDLTLLPSDGFLVDFMTGTTGIALNQNVDQLGLIKESLLAPIAVPMQVGTLLNEQTNGPLADEDPGIPSQNIVNWFVEVE